VAILVPLVRLTAASPSGLRRRRLYKERAVIFRPPLIQQSTISSQQFQDHSISSLVNASSGSTKYSICRSARIPADEPPPPPPPTPEELELEREMEYFVEPEEAFTGRDDIE
jgi:hypothetical protein